MSVTNFLTKFGDVPEAVVALGAVPSATGALAAFISKFGGITESYWFYNHTIELRFDTEEHAYYLVGELGQLVKQDGVTNTVHVIDKSNALVPWGCKMMAEKLLRTIPVMTKEVVPVVDPAAKDYIAAGSPTTAMPFVPELSLEDFTKLVLEAKGAHAEVLEEAGDIGHMAHTWLEWYIKALIAGHKLEAENKLLNLPKDERAANCDMAALGWMHKHNVRWIATERKIYSRKYQVAGTMDGLALVDSCDDTACCFEAFKDRLSLVDWKSSNHLYIEYLLQTAIYVQALTEEFSEVHGPLPLDEDGQRIFDAIAKYGPIHDRWVCRLGKADGEFDPWHTTAEDFQEDMEGFLDALNLTRSVRLINERMKGQKKSIKQAKQLAKELAKEKEKADKKAAKAAEREQKRVLKELEKIQKKLDKALAKGKKDDVLQPVTLVETVDLVGKVHTYAAPSTTPTPWLRPSVTLTTMPVEIVAPSPKFALPEEKL